MLYRKMSKVKAIAGVDEFDFESRLNSFIESLANKGIEYDIETNPVNWLRAYVRYRETVQVPENAADEYRLLGETHVCVECPFYVRPTDGRVKNTHCTINGKTKLASRDKECCDDFYEHLKLGMIKLAEVEA